MDDLPLTISPIAMAIGAVNFAWIIYRFWKKRKQDRQIASINQQMTTITQAVVPQSDEDLDREIDRVLSALASAPTQELYQKTMSLLFKKRDSLLSKVEFKDVVEYMHKCKAIAEQFELMFQKVEEILKDKGVIAAVAAVAAGAGVGLDVATAAPEQKGSAPRPVEVVQPKRSWFCC